jgi:hypothetical protein
MQDKYCIQEFEYILDEEYEKIPKLVVSVNWTGFCIVGEAYLVKVVMALT